MSVDTVGYSTRWFLYSVPVSIIASTYMVGYNYVLAFSNGSETMCMSTSTDTCAVYGCAPGAIDESRNASAGA